MKKLLICLGVTKGGTTWLHWALCKHPQIARIPRKEIHYFLRQYGGVDRLTDAGRMSQFANFARRTKFEVESPEPLARIERTDRDTYGSPWDESMTLNWSEGGESLDRFRSFSMAADWYKHYLRGPINDGWYENLFRKVPDHKWGLDFSTTNYLVNDAGFARMANFTEDTRAILILRDPIERLWSHLKFHAEVAGIHDQLAHWTIDELRDFTAHHNLASSSFYADAVSSLMTHFPENRRMVINFEDLGSRPEELYQDILEFLDLQPIDLPQRDAEEPRMNASLETPFPRGGFSHLAGEFQGDLERLVDMGVSFAEPWIANAEAHKNEQPDRSRLRRKRLGVRTMARKIRTRLRNAI